MSVQSVKVWDDMGHLCFEPSNIPEEIKSQIYNDVHTFYENFKGGSLRFNKLKSHVPERRLINQTVIDYSSLQREKGIQS